MRHILVCLDLSPYSEACLPHAIALARVFGSQVTLLHVMQPAEEHAGGRITDPLGWEVSRREATVYLDRLATDASETWDLAVDSKLAQGRPAERITAIAHDIGADLTVIASHGEGGVAEWKLGGTAQQLLAVSRGSVLVARAASRAAGAFTPERILVPLDGSTRTESVLPTVARIAEAYGAELLLVHVVVEPLPTAVLHAGDLDVARALAARLESRATRYLDHLGARLPRTARVRAVVTRHVDDRQALLEIAEREQADLVVLSAHGSVCNPMQPFGSVTHHLISHSTIPLLVLQDLPEAALGRTGEAAEERYAPPLRASYPPGER
jgi:nucleotide-binding universal stress UspA family protein